MSPSHTVSALSFFRLLRLYIGVFLAAAVSLVPAASYAAEDTGFRTKFDRDLSTGRPTLISTRVVNPPLIDGEVDKDPVWQSCDRTHGAWTQIAGQQASGRQTVVYSCYDETNLYLAFVCEEPELHNVRMDGKLDVDDCVEAILEVGGMEGNGEIYSFRANYRAQNTAWGMQRIDSAKYYTPQWKSAGKSGPNRWMVEMAIPFASLKRESREKGLSTPNRGDVLGLKLVRWGAQQEDPKNRMVSTWNTAITYPFVYMSGMSGRLYFEDANVLRDGEFAMPPQESLWERKGEVSALSPAGVLLGKGGSVSQRVEVRPNCFYLLSVEANGTPDLLVDGKKLALNNQQAGHWSGSRQGQATVTLEAAEPTRVQRLRMEYQPGEEPVGTYCLTNNYRRGNRNIRSLLPDAPQGSYRYVALDNQDQFVWDDNPAIDRQLTSGGARTRPLFATRMEDQGGARGWIPFGDGSLTGKPEIVLWQYQMVEEPRGTYYKAFMALDIDLGQEYYVQGLDVLFPAPYMDELSVWGKAKEQDEWTRLHMDRGTFVDPSKEIRARRAYMSLRGLDSTVRYLRWRAHNGQVRGAKCLDGIEEMWVWGRPKGELAGIKPFQPWILNEGVRPVNWTTTAPDPDACQIVPRPRKMETAEGWFVIGPGTRIVAQPEIEARKVARQIQEEIRERWQLDVPIVEEAALDKGKLDDVIYLGEPVRGPFAEQLREQAKIEIAERPQAYALRASPHRVVVLGRDDDGLYWGVQSLMMAMRWHNSTDSEQNGLGVRCTKVEDWPETLDRSGMAWKSLFIPPYVESEVSRFPRCCSWLSRFKWNACYTGLGTGASWPPDRLAQMCDRIRSEYHLEIRPELVCNPTGGWKGWKNSMRAEIAKDTSVVENNPDEAHEELGEIANLCPLRPQTYELIFAKIDALQELYAWPSKIWLNSLVFPSTVEGSRWGACRECQRSGKSKDELFALLAERVAQHLRERRLRGVMHPASIAFGDRDDPKHQRALVAANVESLPGDFEYGVPDRLSSNELAYVAAHLNPAWTMDGPPEWPSRERSSTSVWPGHEFSALKTFTDLGMRTIRGPQITESMWYGPDKAPQEKFDACDLALWGNSFLTRRDLPSWRAGDRPGFFPLDLCPLMNHTGSPTGKETLEPGRMPAIDLRYVPTGRQVLSGVEFDVIDPKENNGKSILMLGRPTPSSTHPKDAEAVMEEAAPIPVGRKVASLAFLRAGWLATFMTHPAVSWMFSTCRVVYDDDTWLPVDCFEACENADQWNNTTQEKPWIDRLGWQGNCPGGSPVQLRVNEWVNPYPEKVVKSLQFFTPDFEQGNGRKRSNYQCQAFLAITAIEPIEQDFNYWSRCTRKPPLLPPLKPLAPGVALQRTLAFRELGATANCRTGPMRDEEEAEQEQMTRILDPVKRSYALRLTGTEGEIQNNLELSSGTDWETISDYSLPVTEFGPVGNNVAYKPFAVTQTFAPAPRLCRVDIRGPNCQAWQWMYRLGRNHRLDVTLEISEDGDRWRTVGELKGISGEADYLPIEFEPTRVKMLRLTATAAPYHEDYNPRMADRRAPLDWPHFTWRLIAPAGTAKNSASPENR